MAWFLNPALTRFRNEVNARWPRRDKTSDGTIGDTAHQGTNSDHNPDADGSVDAWDMDVDGVDVAACKRAFQAHEAAHYWIHNDRICFRDEGWRPRSYAYAGPNRNRHTKHVHWNSRPSHERSTKPWFTTEDDMTPAEFTAALTAALDDAGVKARLRSIPLTYPVTPTQSLLSKFVTAFDKIDLIAAEAAVSRLGTKATPEEQADLLRAMLGDRAKEVGLLLSQG